MSNDHKTLSAPERLAKPKYQIFVSSTFADLHEERSAVTWEILKANHIPVGMEDFPATDNRGWKIIQRTIDSSDYYVLLIAGRYGSTNPDTGKSWTQTEYEYARSRGLKVLAFTREKSAITADKMDDHEKATKLSDFIAIVEKEHLVKRWKHRDDLRAEVANALRYAIEEDENDGTLPRGWYRGAVTASPEVTNELAKLSAENRELRAKLDAVTTTTTFALEILDGDGDHALLTDVSFKATPALLSPAEITNRFSHREMAIMRQMNRVDNVAKMESYNHEIVKILEDPQKLEELRQYAIAKAIPDCTCVAFAIRSVNGPTANDVRCEMVFPDGFALIRKKQSEPQLPYWLPDRPDPTALDLGTAALRSFMSATPVARNLLIMNDMTGLSDLQIEKRVIKLHARKLQHGQSYVLDGKDEIVAVLPPAGFAGPFEIRYRIWSDETPERSGVIPFKLVSVDVEEIKVSSAL